MSNDMDVSSSFLAETKSHLKSIMKARGLSINAAAEIAGVNRATMRRWLDDREHSCIDIPSAILLFQHLNLPMTVLFPATPWITGNTLQFQQLLCYLNPAEQVWALSVVMGAREIFTQKSRRPRSAR